MLRIRKGHGSIKALSAGSLAFAIGLMSVAAYVGSTFIHENLVFDRAQTAKTEPAEQTNPIPIEATAEETDANGGSLTASQGAVMSGSSTPMTPSASSVMVPTPGRGSGELPAVPVVPVLPVVPTPDPVPVVPVPGDTDGDGVVDTVIDVVDDVTDGLIGL